MTALPAAASFTGGSITEGDFKTAITDLRAFLAGLLGTDGLPATALATVGAFNGSTVLKTTAYTVVAADRGKNIYATGTWTLSLTAAATLGSGFSFLLTNLGTGLITIDPSGAETINAAATIIVSPGESVMVMCNGTNFTSYGAHYLPGMTADAAPDTAADYVAVWDSSVGGWKKVLLANAAPSPSTLLASGSLSGANLTLSSISGAYRDLRLLLIGSSTNGATLQPKVTFNGDSATSYYFHVVGNNAVVMSASDTGIELWPAITAGADAHHHSINIENYAKATYKTVRASGSRGTTAAQNRDVYGVWASTAAVTSIVVDAPGANNFDGGTYELWGIK